AAVPGVERGRVGRHRLGLGADPCGQRGGERDGAGRLAQAGAFDCEHETCHPNTNAVTERRRSPPLRFRGELGAKDLAIWLRAATDVRGHVRRGDLNGRREPIFNAPWPPVAMAGAIVGLYAWQSLAPLELVVDRFGFSPAKFAAGDWAGAVTALFVHGTWMHALLNAAFALAFGAPVARFLGGSGKGLAAFFTFYLGCGVLANLGHAAVHPGDPTSLVGASGAVAGLMGAAARLIATR